MISVLILTYNEQDNVGFCLDAVAWCDDIHVVDSLSSDDTPRIATTKGARVSQRKWTNFADQRNYALENLALKHDWVLHLDADELVTEKLKQEMLLIAEEESKFGAYEVPFRVFFMGRFLRFGGSYPGYQVRFGRKDVLRFRQVGHGQKEEVARGPIGQLRNPLLHYSFSKGISAWISKHNAYSDADWKLTFDAARAQAAGRSTATRIRRALRETSRLLPFRPALRFVYMYIVQLGFLDGMAGFHFCMLNSIYEYFISLKKIDRRGPSAMRNSTIPRGAIAAPRHGNQSRQNEGPPA